MRKGKLRRWVSQVRSWIEKHVPPGLRTLLGLLLIAGGIVGFLPILGFWMIPLGIGLIALDTMCLYQFVRKMIENEPASEDGDENKSAATGREE